MFLPNISFGEMAIVLLLGIFSGLWIVPTALDMIKKKYSKRNNSLYLIMLIFFLFVLLAYIFETTLTNKQHVYLADYFLKFISYSWLGITSLWITKTKEKN